MSEEESRYIVQAFDDCSWSIVDTTTMRVYALGLSQLGNLIVHVFLAELIASTESTRYISYAREILSCHVEVSDLSVGIQLLDFILNELHDGVDVDNPIEPAFRLGADLHGQPVGWPEQRAH